jgi:proteasome lid subunit RPN8/RPN11
MLVSKSSITLPMIDVDAIQEAALRRWPHEMCGVLTREAGFIECVNISNDTTRHFEIDAIEYRKLEKAYTIIGLAHSHTRQSNVNYGPATNLDPRTPSRMDVNTQKLLGIPFYIVATDGEQVTSPICYPGDPNATLYNRPFIYFINDCFTLVRDYHWQKYQIKLDLHHPKFDWWNGGNGGVTTPFYELYFEEWGFKKIERYELEVGDVIVMGMQGRGNHLGIFTEGYNILQHVQDHPSGEIPMNKWDSYIQGYLRHKEKPKL